MPQEAKSGVTHNVRNEDEEDFGDKYIYGEFLLILWFS